MGLGGLEPEAPQGPETTEDGPLSRMREGEARGTSQSRRLFPPPPDQEATNAGLSNLRNANPGKADEVVTEDSPWTSFL